MNKRRWAWRVIVVALMFGLSIMPAVAQATTITFDFTFEFSEATPPSGPTPWLRAVFDDGAAGLSDNQVKLSLSAENLTGSEFVSEWDFNFNPAKDLSNLEIVLDSGIAPDSISKGVNQFKADGDGKYDIQFLFPTGSTDDQFTVDSESVFILSGIDGLVLAAADFNFLSMPAGGKGPFVSAAHVQGIDPSASRSGWVAGVLVDDDLPPSELVPEPGTILLLGSGLLGLAAIGMRKRSGRR